MAESIVRLRVESQEFESKLKRASQELLAMADNARRTGATFAIADKEELAFVQSLGQLQTSARSAKGQIAEMSKAFQDLSMHYRSLTVEEKAAPYGQELKKSLEQLQQRINDGKQALGEINGKIGESKGETNLLSGAVNELTGKLGINIPKLGAMSIAIAGVTGALKVAKDAFFKNEQQLDEWGRMTESSKSLYSGFLDALNTGDISGYLQRINQIVDAARKAYDALDELGTYNAFNQVNVSRDRQRLTNAMADYREGKGSAEDVKTAGNAVIANLHQEAQKADNAYRAAVNKIAAEKGVSGKELYKILNGSYADYERAKNVPMTGVKYNIHTNQYGQSWTTTEKFAKTPAEKMGVALRSFNDTALQDLQKLGAEKDRLYNEEGMVRRQVARILGSAKTAATGTGGGGSYTPPPTTKTVEDPFAGIKFQQGTFDGGLISNDFSKNIAELANMYVKTSVADSLRQLDPEQAKAMLQGEDTENVFKGADLRQTKKEDKKQSTDMSKLYKGVGAIANITGALQNMGIKLPEGLTKAISIMQSLCTIIQSVETLISVFSTSTQTSNTVAVGANTVALGTLEAAIIANTATNFIPFAHGGIAHAAHGFVGGNNYSGDVIPIAVNSGELILNRAQQGNLASQLSGAGLGGLTLSTRLHAKEIEFVLDRNLRDTSRGKYVTTKRNG